MQSITFDCRQLDKVDWSKQVPGPIGRASARHRTKGFERDALLAALRFGSALDNTVAKAHTVATIATSPPAAVLLKPPSMPTGAPISVTFSKSSFVTGAFGVAASVSMGVGFVTGSGIYGSSTREIGVYQSYGGGIFSAGGASGGGEFTVIYGTPADFSGLYFGLTVGGGVGVLGVGGTLLFSPSSLGIPMVLTLMGFSIGVSGSTPGLPVNVAVTVTNTKIAALHRW